jgi:hypothetical protein
MKTKLALRVFCHYTVQKGNRWRLSSVDLIIHNKPTQEASSSAAISGFKTGDFVLQTHICIFQVPEKVGTLLTS